ncbi:hypothetical protein R3P38DRAFT_2771398 [Favolaschia claudopus]|uniref:Uncharacterized protein n=1 Tax=Favolaschia claudopus TaxID=2862362 RepID=A0AAW0C7T0_9AGAR
MVVSILIPPLLFKRAFSSQASRLNFNFNLHHLRHRKLRRIEAETELVTDERTESCSSLQVRYAYSNVLRPRSNFHSSQPLKSSSIGDRVSRSFWKGLVFEFVTKNNRGATPSEQDTISDVVSSPTLLATAHNGLKSVNPGGITVTTTTITAVREREVFNGDLEESSYFRGQ